MNMLLKLAPLALVAFTGFAHANTNEHSDAATAHKDTVKTRTVAYACQGGKKVKVKYGFNKQNLPTYAEAKLNGKTRFMPINLNFSDNITTRFGDDNNFSLSADAMTYKKYRAGTLNILSPSSEMLYKLCKAR